MPPEILILQPFCRIISKRKLAKVGVLVSDLQIQLIKYNEKTWGKSALLGFFIGLAVIVPGISGSTVAIIFKLYDQFLYAIGNLFKEGLPDVQRCRRRCSRKWYGRSWFGW